MIGIITYLNGLSDDGKGLVRVHHQVGYEDYVAGSCRAILGEIQIV